MLCLVVRQIFLGLAHISRRVHGKRSLQLSYHIFYAFSPSPPFQLIGLGRPFMFPSETSMVQSASGMLLQQSKKALIIFWGEQDCEARRASLPLEAVLSQLRLLDDYIDDISQQ